MDDPGHTLLALTTESVTAWGTVAIAVGTFVLAYYAYKAYFLEREKREQVEKKNAELQGEIVLLTAKQPSAGTAPQFSQFSSTGTQTPRE